MKIKLITDAACDLDINYVRENDIEVIPLELNFKGEFIKDDLGQNLSYKDFYKAMREGETPTTTQINIQTFINVFNKYIKEGYEILYLGVSSTVSGTYNSALKAKEMIKEENKEAKIHTIDTASGSVGEGLLVYKSNKMLKENNSIEEIIDYIEKIKSKVKLWITVDDLNHLRRGGRVSKASAVIGTMLNIKPILTLDEEGKLKVVSKMRGRKKALKCLFNKYVELAKEKENQTVFISSGDAEEDAEYIKSLLIKESKVKEVFINSIGCVLGSHGGPGSLLIAFLG